MLRGDCLKMRVFVMKYQTIQVCIVSLFRHVITGGFSTSTLRFEKAGSSVVSESFRVVHGIALFTPGVCPSV